MSRDKLPAILIDSDFFDKPRNLAFIRKCGSKGMIAVQAIWCLLSRERDWCLDESMMIPEIIVAKVLAHDPFSPDEWKEFLLNCVEFGLLETKIIKGKTIYFNSRVVEHGQSFIEKRKGYKNGWSKRKKMDSEWIHDETISESENGFDMVRTNTKPYTLNHNTNDLDLDKKELSAEKPPPGFREGAEGCGEYQHVFLKPEERDALVSDFGVVAVESKITHLDSQIENDDKKYKKYKNHAACVRNWCTSDRAQGKVPKEEPLPKGYTWVSREMVRGPDRQLHHISFVRNMFEGQNL